MAQTTIQTRLCPHCANSIALDTLTCPYCKMSLNAAATLPQWPGKDDDAPVAEVELQRAGMPLGSKFIMVLGLLMFALGVYLVGGQNERSDLAPQLDAKVQELQDREVKIKSLEAQLAQAREELKGSAARLEELKTIIAEKEKSLAVAQKQVKDSNRELERLASRGGSAPLPPARTRVPSQTMPQPAPAGRRAFEPGLYETVRSTAVHEEPLGSSRVLTRISGGTKITVVRGAGEWLEVRSKHGNPPGFVRADDAKFVGRAN